MTVVFATDFMGDVHQGLSLASRLAAERGTKLVVAHVVPLSVRDGEGMLHASVDLLARPRARAVKALAPVDPSVPHALLLRVGEPEEELVRVSEERHAALLVMEARARGPLARLLGRGLIERLGARVGCPIVTYQPRPSAPPLRQPAAKSSLPHGVALKVVLDARVDAILHLLDGRLRDVGFVAARSSVRDGIASLVNSRDGLERSSSRRRVRDELTLELSERMRPIDAVGLEIWIDPDGDRACALSMGATARSAAQRDALIEAVLGDGPSVRLPIQAATDGDPPLVLAGTRLPLPGGRSAALVMGFDARRGFMRILGEPGPRPSVETYAFDARGVMLSNSRFAHDLETVGLLSVDDETAGRIRVCDPGESLLDRQLQTPSETWPLTKMAASAIAGHDGVDTFGYRDYRGVPVIGAWRWLAGLEVGIAAEMDLPAHA